MGCTARPVCGCHIEAMSSFGSLASVVAMASAGSESMNMYFGLGCNWGSQNLFVEKFERPVANRSDAEITSIAGYAGSRTSGPDGQVCYYNDQNISYISQRLLSA